MPAYKSALALLFALLIPVGVQAQDLSQDILTDQARLDADQARLTDDEALLAQWQPLVQNSGRLNAWMRGEEGKLRIRQLASARGASDWRADPNDVRSEIVKKVEALNIERNELVISTRILSKRIAENRIRARELLNDVAQRAIASPAAPTPML